MIKSCWIFLQLWKWNVAAPLTCFEKCMKETFQFTLCPMRRSWSEQGGLENLFANFQNIPHLPQLINLHRGGTVCRRPYTWLVGHAGGEEEALLCGGGGSQRPLVVWKHRDHQRRHVTLDLRDKKKKKQSDGREMQRWNSPIPQNCKCAKVMQQKCVHR